jgi:hypothetical protein
MQIALKKYIYEAGRFNENRLNNKRGAVFASDMEHALKLVKRLHAAPSYCIWSTQYN